MVADRVKLEERLLLRVSSTVVDGMAGRLRESLPRDKLVRQALRDEEADESSMPLEEPKAERCLAGDRIDLTAGV